MLLTMRKGGCRRGRNEMSGAGRGKGGGRDEKREGGREERKPYECQLHK